MADEIVETEAETIETPSKSLNREAIDQQIATAKEYPRSVDSCLKEAKTLATRDKETAESCFYALPRSGGTVRGPSIRLAEIFLYSWQNLRASSRVVDVLKKEVVAEAVAFDLEKNSAARKEVSRSIVDSDGHRYPDHLIRTTQNAACSIALRNTVFTVIPRPFVDDAYDAAREAAMNDGETIEKKREKMMRYFKGEGVNEDQVYEILDANGPEDIGEQDILDMRGLVNAIEDDQVSISEVFGDKSERENAKINQWIDNDEEKDGDEEE